MDAALDSWNFFRDRRNSLCKWHKWKTNSLCNFLVMILHAPVGRALAIEVTSRPVDYMKSSSDNLLGIVTDRIFGKLIAHEQNFVDKCVDKLFGTLVGQSFKELHHPMGIFVPKLRCIFWNDGTSPIDVADFNKTTLGKLAQVPCKYLVNTRPDLPLHRPRSFSSVEGWLKTSRQPTHCQDTHERRIHLSAAVAKREKHNASHQCTLCHAQFASRSAMFRHLRSDPDCVRRSWSNETKECLNSTGSIRQTVAFLFAYYSNRTVEFNLQEKSEAEVAGQLLRKAVAKAASALSLDELGVENGTEITGSTQACIAKCRAKALSQEMGCAASGDAMVISFLALGRTNSESRTRVNNQEERNHFLNHLLMLARKELERNPDPNVCVRILSCKWVPCDSTWHMELDCTQRTYHYLLPVRWMPAGDEIEHWWLNGVKVANVSNQRMDLRFKATNRGLQVESRAPPGLRTFQQAIRSSESVKAPAHAQSIVSMKSKRAGTRFKDLANKEKRSWHNFADPELRGDASPNIEPVWRVLDRVHSDLLTPRRYGSDPDAPDEAIALLVFRGDDFVSQQIRRIVGTALAIAHGWLPANVFDVATRADVFVETPIAPPGRLYFAEARFHWHERRRNKTQDRIKGMFEDSEAVRGIPPYKLSPTNASVWIQEQLLDQKASAGAKHAEDKWFEDLRDIVAPRIRAKLDALSHDRNSNISNPNGVLQSLQLLNSPPAFYVHTLTLLRGIVAAGRWPKTSIKRSSVIRNKYEQHQSQSSCAGSFTVVNPKFQDGIYRYGVGSDPLPLANKLFPDLVSSVFDLEEILSRTRVEQASAGGAVGDVPSSVSKRASSSHCAINCNAEFTPHVDSGRGAGQTMSMIVGLGNYVGGELAVEGRNFNIRYKALEFNGWKLRHWTNQFVGERFSLVWFTPAITEN